MTLQTLERACAGVWLSVATLIDLLRSHVEWRGKRQSDGHHINTSQSQYSVAQAEAECMVYNILVCINVFVSVDSNGSA